jgi:hypothetical protein
MAAAASALREADAADNAAADAAVEARREALESGAQKPLPRAKGLAKPGRRTRPEWHRFEVVGWLTNFNSVEFGIYKRSRNKAKSRQFTSDMDIYAEVIENGERKELIGYREDLWSKNAGMDKRLVFKLFSGTLNWRATMDLMLARSIQQTIGARGLPVMTYSINTNDHDQVVYLERSANKWPLLPEHFSFFLLEDGKLEFFRIRQRLISIGQDYAVYNDKDEMVAYLDGALLTLTSRWRCRVRADYKDRRFYTVLKMFCGMLVFNKQCRRHLKQVARAVRSGRYEPTIERLEADLYMNPRRVR